MVSVCTSFSNILCSALHNVKGVGHQKMWQFCSPCFNWKLFAKTLASPPPSFSSTSLSPNINLSKVMWAYLSKLPLFLPKAFVNQIWSKSLPGMWWMLLFSDLRQLVHYAVQVRGQKIFNRGIIPSKKKNCVHNRITVFGFAICIPPPLGGVF